MWVFFFKVMTCSLISGSTIFKIFTKVPLNNVIWKLKIDKKSFLNLIFKHPKMRNVTQILLRKHSYQTCFYCLSYVAKQALDV